MELENYARTLLLTGIMTASLRSIWESNGHSGTDDIPVNPVMDRVLDLPHKTAKEPEAVKQILPRFRSLTKHLPLPYMRIAMWSQLIPFHFQVMG